MEVFLFLSVILGVVVFVVGLKCVNDYVGIRYIIWWNGMDGVVFICEKDIWSVLDFDYCGGCVVWVGGCVLNFVLVCGDGSGCVCGCGGLVFVWFIWMVIES